AMINFQPVGAPTPAGYIADAGQIYGDRGNGLFYGWSADNTAHMSVRHSSLAPDSRYDTLAQMQKGSNFTWEIAVPNGDYAVDVHPVVGISTSVPAIFEDGSARGQFQFMRTGSLSDPLSVQYAIDGSATGGKDYDALGGVATFAAGSSTATIDVVSHPDFIA